MQKEAVSQTMTSEPEDKPQDAQKDGAAPVRKRKSKRRRAAVGLLSLIALIALVVVGFVGLLALKQEPLEAPEWVQSRLEAQLNKALTPYSAEMGTAALTVDEGWVPRIVLRDVEFRDQAGARLVVLDTIEARAAIAPLMRGKLHPSTLSLSGSRLLLRRDKNGTFWLSFGEELNASGQGKGFAELIGGIDALLMRPEFSEFASIVANDVTLRYEDERADRAWTVDGGRLDLGHKDGELDLRADFAVLTGGAVAAGVELSFASTVGSPNAIIGMSLTDFPARDLASQSPAVSWLEALRAPISGALRVEMNEDGELGPLSGTLQIGEGVLQPNDSTSPVPFTAARTYFTYDPVEQIVQFDEINLQSEWVTLRADGKLGLVMSKTGWPSAYVGQLRFGEIAAKPGDFLSDKVSFDSGYADIQLRLDPFRVSLGQLDLTDGDTRFHVEGTFAALAEGWGYHLQAGARGLEVEHVMRLWPPQVSTRTRDWVAANVLEGRLDEAQVGLRAGPGDKPSPYIAFAYSDVTLRFIDTMPLIKGLSGQASLLRNRFAARATKGTITAPQGGTLDIAGTEFIIPKTGPSGVTATVNAAANGQITALLSTLDQEPLNLITKAGQSVTMADGQVKAKGLVSWVMQRNLPTDAVQFDVSATLTDVRSESLVPGRVLAAQALQANAKNGSLVISGDGRIDTVPFSGKFTAPLGKGSSAKSTITGSIELSPKFVSAFNIGLPSGTVTGRGRGTINISLTKGGSASFALTSNLSGVGLSIPQIGWRKAAKSTGKLSVTGAFGSPMKIDRIVLNAAGLDARGNVRLGTGGSFKDARFERVTVGRWFNAPVTFVGRGKGRVPAIEVNGGKIDLSRTSFSSGGGSSGGGGPITARLGELKISEGIALTGFQGNFNTARGFEGNFTGLVNGRAPVKGRVVPQSGRSAFQISSDDGGKVLAAAGLLKNAAGGAMTLTLAPAKAEGTYNGALDIKNTRLRDAPAMAALLNAASIIGLLEQLGGQGIQFNQVEARFQMTPTQVIVSRSSAVGASMGISMDGYYNLGSGQMDMQGVVSPIFLVNGIGAIFTRKGEGLVGFNYKLRGTGANPKVNVNPLSLFTPGMFREIFRRPAPEVNR
ncbi:AsmA-like C-terminal region-containing protein [Lentibacter algarum]|uniref:AsmA-like C-terminal region-containing protein n=1 Tax=Lentibacter algarum TaxID=576131 RepID=UPI001C07F060|nr:AsmA-like C-terminal region-containing protein [Lentibacter algarum]MBU2982550.1 AsmA-like C-terminal region-containing protein [Lentibacter algarum]